MSGCEEEASPTIVEGNFEIELWFYSCFNETNVSGDSWVDYKMTNLGKKPVTDVNVSFLPRTIGESPEYLFLIMDKTDEILPDEDFSAVQSVLITMDDVYYEYLTVEIEISYNHPDYTEKKTEQYAGKLLRSVLWYEVGCEAPVYFLFEVEFIGIADS